MNLEKIREKIDDIDSKILELLHARMQLALMARQFKTQIEDRERETQLLDRLKKSSTDLLSADFIGKIYNQIISESKDLQRRHS